jgi:hypothetical protein
MNTLGPKYGGMGGNANRTHRNPVAAKPPGIKYLTITTMESNICKDQSSQMTANKQLKTTTPRGGTPFPDCSQPDS